jgi:hypothetical protein
MRSRRTIIAGLAMALAVTAIPVTHADRWDHGDRHLSHDDGSHEDD